MTAFGPHRSLRHSRGMEMHDQPFRAAPGEDKRDAVRKGLTVHHTGRDARSRNEDAVVGQDYIFLRSSHVVRRLGEERVLKIFANLGWATDDCLAARAHE